MNQSDEPEITDEQLADLACLPRAELEALVALVAKMSEELRDRLEEAEPLSGDPGAPMPGWIDRCIALLASDAAQKAAEEVLELQERVINLQEEVASGTSSFTRYVESVSSEFKRQEAELSRLREFPEKVRQQVISVYDRITTDPSFPTGPDAFAHELLRRLGLEKEDRPCQDR